MESQKRKKVQNDEEKRGSFECNLSAAVENTQFDLIANPAAQDVESFRASQEDFKEIQSPNRRSRLDSDLSQVAMNRVLFQFQNDNSFFEQSRPRIQSEINVLGRIEYSNNYSAGVTKHSSFKKNRPPKHSSSFYSNRTKISVAYSANSDQVINDDLQQFNKSNERRASYRRRDLSKYTNQLFSSPIAEDDNDFSQKSAKQKLEEKNHVKEVENKQSSSNLIECKTMK